MPVSLPPGASQKYHGIIHDVFEAPLKQYDGSIKIFEYILRADCVTVFAFPSPDRMIVTYQEQPGRPPFWDFPGGRVEQHETHEQAALRELQEETGLRAKRIKPFWNLTLEGATRFEKSFFVATDLEPIDDRSNPDNGEKIQVLHESFDEVVKRCHKRQMRQAEAMLCIMNMAYDEKTRQEMHEWLKT